jgi:hypothetical protein
MAWRMMVYGTSTITDMLLRSDIQSIMTRSTRLESFRVPGITQLTKKLGFAVSQLN